MASVRFMLGAEADIATADEVGKIVDESTDKIMSKLPTRHRGLRHRIPASANVNPAATGTVILDFGTPSPDSMWWLVEVCVMGADDRTAIAGAAAALYLGSAPRQLTATTITDNPQAGNLVRPGIAVPGVFVFEAEVFPVHTGENLFSIVYSPTTAISVVSGVATVIELPASAVMLNRA